MSECVISTLHGSFCFERVEASPSKVHVFEQQHYLPQRHKAQAVQGWVVKRPLSNAA